MQPQAIPKQMPDSLIQSLHALEAGYWWYVGRVFWAKQLIQEWLEQCPENQFVSYADVGCGTGGFAREIANVVPMKQGMLIDGDERMLQIARTRTNFDIVKADFSAKLPLPWQPNLVTCMDVIEHLPDERFLLSEIASQLPKKGMLVISVPAFSFLFSEWDKQQGHYRRYSMRSLRDKIEGAGLKIVQLKYMWSFMFPAAPIRRLKAKRYQQNMEFEQVPDWINRSLIAGSKLEYRVSKIVSLPFGTSVVASAIKE